MSQIGLLKNINNDVVTKIVWKRLAPLWVLNCNMFENLQNIKFKATSHYLIA